MRFASSGGALTRAARRARIGAGCNGPCRGVSPKADPGPGWDRPELGRTPPGMGEAARFWLRRARCGMAPHWKSDAVPRGGRRRRTLSDEQHTSQVRPAAPPALPAREAPDCFNAPAAPHAARDRARAPRRCSLLPLAGEGRGSGMRGPKGGRDAWLAQGCRRRRTLRGTSRLLGRWRGRHPHPAGCAVPWSSRSSRPSLRTPLPQAGEGRAPRPIGVRAPYAVGTRSRSRSQALALASEGARQSARGDRLPPAEIFGPLGMAVRLNCAVW